MVEDHKMQNLPDDRRCEFEVDEILNSTLLMQMENFQEFDEQEAKLKQKMNEKIILRNNHRTKSFATSVEN